MILATLFEPSLSKLLPWRRTEHTAKADGYPYLTVVFGCLYFPLAGSIFQVVASALLISTGNSTNHDEDVLSCVISSFLAAYNGVCIMTLVLYLKVYKLQDLVVVNPDDVVAKRQISTGLELEDSFSQQFMTNNPLREMREELELERHVRLAAETQANAFERKSVVLRSTLYDKESQSKQLQDMATKKDLEILSLQLQRHGLQALRYLPLAEIQAEIQKVFDKLNPEKDMMNYV